MKYPEKKIKSNLNMDHYNQLLEWIAKAKEKGVDNKEITKLLVKSGWKRAVIKKFL
jgi:hypothetical protein